MQTVFTANSGPREAIAWLDVALMEGAKTKVDVGPPTQKATRSPGRPLAQGSER